MDVAGPTSDVPGRKCLVFGFLGLVASLFRLSGALSRRRRCRTSVSLASPMPQMPWVGGNGRTQEPPLPMPRLPSQLAQRGWNQGRVEGVVTYPLAPSTEASLRSWILKTDSGVKGPLVSLADPEGALFPHSVL